MKAIEDRIFVLPETIKNVLPAGLSEQQVTILLTLPHEVKTIIKIALQEVYQAVDQFKTWVKVCSRYCLDNPSLKYYLELIKPILFDLEKMILRPQLKDFVFAYL